MKQYLFAFGALLLLVGAGCDNAAPTEETTTSPAAKDAGNEESMTDDSLMEDDLFETSPVNGDITLSAEAREDGEVRFEWELPEGTEYDGFILVRGEEANPVHTGKNYWFRQYYTRRAVTWTELPTGDWHVRICGLEGDECAVYSNDVMVTVE